MVDTRPLVFPLGRPADWQASGIRFSPLKGGYIEQAT